jgi:hypothetical protein
LNLSTFTENNVRFDFEIRRYISPIISAAPDLDEEED